MRGKERASIFGVTESFNVLKSLLPVQLVQTASRANASVSERAGLFHEQKLFEWPSLAHTLPTIEHRFLIALKGY